MGGNDWTLPRCAAAANAGAGEAAVPATLLLASARHEAGAEQWGSRQVTHSAARWPDAPAGGPGPRPFQHLCLFSTQPAPPEQERSVQTPSSSTRQQGIPHTHQ
jgi:hypothetical protein